VIGLDSTDSGWDTVAGFREHFHKGGNYVRSRITMNL
jgi:hypothetical protein